MDLSPVRSLKKQARRAQRLTSRTVHKLAGDADAPSPDQRVATTAALTAGPSPTVPAPVPTAPPAASVTVAAPPVPPVADPIPAPVKPPAKTPAKASAKVSAKAPVKAAAAAKTPAKTAAPEAPARPVPARPAANAAQVKLWTLLDEQRRLPLKRKQILWESFHGKGMLCHPAAMFRWMLERPEYADVQHVWALNMIKEYPDVVAEFGQHPRVRFVDVYSDAYYEALCRSAYLVNNTSFPPVFVTRPDQVYLNTWHGTPLKTLGFDIPNGAFESKNVLRNLLMADLVLSSGPYMTERMYAEAYRMAPIYDGTVLQLGSPRVDVQLTPERDAEVRDRLAAKGLHLPHWRTVVYAPTWKGRSAYRPGDEAGELLEIVQEIASRPELAEVNVALRVHALVYRALRRHPKLAPYLVPDTVETNELLAVTDVLITDYSSLFFDFLASDRPILFHIPDLETYEADRGYYLPPDTWPGALTRSNLELADQVVAALDGRTAPPASTAESDHAPVDYAARRAEWRATYAPDEDGQSSRRAVERLLGRGGDPAREIRLADTSRQRLLIYAGPFLPNGITTSALNLFSQLDYDKYDVTVVFQWGSQREKYDAIDPRVRQIIWQNPMPLTEAQLDERAIFLRTGYDPEQVDLDVIETIFAREWRRTFGNTTFDHVINFEGYTIFWSAFLLSGRVKRSSIWLHNDLDWDQQKVIDGKRPHETMLAAQFSSYQRWDSLVSVSTDLMRVNRSKLYRYAKVENFTAVPNVIDAAVIDARTFGAHLADPEQRPNAYFEPATPELAKVGDAIDGSSMAATFDRLFSTYRRHDLQAEMRRRVSIDRWCSRPPGVFQFVSLGRLSPEKNHTLLLQAFALVREEAPTARLVIAGDGPLREQVEAEVRRLKFGRAVRIAGHLDDGLAVLANSDALVMSSLYEGLPMTILEAKYLRVPVVTTDFGTVGSALADNEGIITDMSPRSLADGMLAAIRGKAPESKLDPDLWNESAMERFDALIQRSSV